MQYPKALAAIVLCFFELVVCPTVAVGQNRSTPEPAFNDFATANGFLHRGMNELAEQEFRKFLTQYPQHEKAALARYGLGVALTRLGKLNEAAVELKPLRALPQFEFAAEVTLLLGQSYLASQQFTQAADCFRVFLESHADHASADLVASLLVESLYHDGDREQIMHLCEVMKARWPKSSHRQRAELFHGMAAFNGRDYEKAAKLFTSIQREFQTNALTEQATLLLGQSLQQLNRVDEAAEQYRHYLKNDRAEQTPEALFGLATSLRSSEGSEAMRCLERLIKNYPDHSLTANAWLALGRIHFDATQYEKAAQAFERAAMSPTLNAEASYLHAKSMMKNGRYAEAAAGLQQALERNPATEVSPEMAYDLGVAYMRAGEEAAAVTALDRYRTTYSTHNLAPEAAFLCAVLAHRQRENDACRLRCQEFLKTFENHPRVPDVLFLLAENELITGDFAEAEAGYLSLLTRFPDSEHARNARFQRGTALFNLNRYAEAAEELSHVIEGRQTPAQFRNALLMLGDIHFDLRNWRDAISSFDDYLAFGTEQRSADIAMLKLGIAYLRSENIDAAYSHFVQLIEHMPESAHRAHALFELGQIHLGRKNNPDAIVAFTAIKDGYPDSELRPLAQNHIAGLAMQQGDFETAASLYRELAALVDMPLRAEASFKYGQALMSARQFGGAAQALQVFLKDYPDHEEASAARAHLALALVRDGKCELALPVMQAIESDHARSNDRSLLAIVQYEQAWCLRDAKRNDDAAATYRQIISSFAGEPIVPHAMVELAELERESGRYAEAIELFSRVRSTNHASPELAEAALYNLALCEFEQERFDESAARAQEFIDAFPKSVHFPAAVLLCAESHYKRGALDKALSHFADLVKGTPAGDPSRHTNLLRLGECYAAAQRWQDSERVYVSHRQEFPESDQWFQAQFGLAWAQENQSRHQDAIAAYRVIPEKHSGSTAARAQFQIGECLFAMKDYQAAIRELLRVDILFAFPEWSAAALYETGRCYEELGHPTDAKSHFDQVERRFPNTSWARMASKRSAALAASTATAP